MKQLPTPIFNVMIDGLTQLHLLRLPYAPAAKGLPAVAVAWEKAFLARCEFPENSLSEDCERLQTAFDTVSAAADRWPLPKDIIDHLPPRKPLPALPEPDVVPMPDDVAELLTSLADKMRM